MMFGTASWWEAVLPGVVAAVLLLVPGAVAVRLAGGRGVSQAAAPALSVGTIAVAGIAAARVGVRWGALTLLVAVAAAWLAALLLGRLLPGSPARLPTRSRWATVVGGLGALAATAAVLLPVSPSPEQFPQHPDTLYHLGLIRTMLTSHDISVLDAGKFTSPTGAGGFYPAAFHDVVATVAMLSGAPFVVCTSATVLVVAGLVWPLGLMAVARQAFGDGPAPVLGAAAASVAFSAFPFWLMGYGVLWPNLLGQALLPGLLAVAACVASGNDVRRGVALLLLGLPGLALSHPNAVFALFLIGLTMTAAALLRQVWSSRRRAGRAAVWAATLLTVLAISAGGWWVATTRAASFRASNPRGPEMSRQDAVLDVLFQGPRGAPPLWVLGVVVVLGAVVVLVKWRRQWWVVASLVGFGFLYYADTAVDTTRTRLFTWPWYNNSPRLAALLVVPAAVAAAAAVAGFATLLSRLSWLSRRGRRRDRPAGAAASLAAVTAFTLATAGLGNAAHREVLRPFFEPTRSGSFASVEEVRALQELAARVPRDATVAENPWRGGGYLYVVSGRRMLFPTEKSNVGDDRRLLGRQLDRAGTSPEVCAAARRQGVKYALTGGDVAAMGRSSTKQYAGVDRVGDSAAFVLVARAGPYSLFRLTRCAGS